MVVPQDNHPQTMQDGIVLGHDQQGYPQEFVLSMEWQMYRSIVSVEMDRYQEYIGIEI